MRRHEAAPFDAFRVVQVVDVSISGLTLLEPCGTRVEGLDLATLVALLRRLAA